MKSDGFAFTRFGRYLQELRARVPGPVVADMFCLLRLELELAVQAKALLIAREAGLDVPVTDDLEAILDERRYLQESIGKIGLLALKPLQVTSHRDDWHRHLLKSRQAPAGN
jgi:protease PrsW